MTFFVLDTLDVVRGINVVAGASTFVGAGRSSVAFYTSENQNPQDTSRRPNCYVTRLASQDCTYGAEARRGWGQHTRNPTFDHGVGCLCRVRNGCSLRQGRPYGRATRSATPS